jgi:hypothetical protein
LHFIKKYDKYKYKKGEKFMEYIVVGFLIILLSFFLAIVLNMILNFIIYFNDFEVVKFDKEELIKKHGNKETVLKFLENKYPKVYKSEVKKAEKNITDYYLVDNICTALNNKYCFTVNVLITLILGIILSCTFISITCLSKERNYEDFEIKYNTYISLLENDSYDKNIISLAEDIANLNIEINENQRNYKKPLGKYFIDERFMDLEFLTFHNK